MFIFLILQWFLVIVLFIVLTLLFLWAWTIVTASVPFVPVPNSILKDINKALDLKEKSVFYDLGCGDGRVVFYLSKKNPKAKCIGIENNIFPIILSNINLWWYNKFSNSELEILNKDFFKQDLSSATDILVYLYPNVMDKLLPKLDTELKPGTRLVSVSFKFTGKQPIFEIDLKRGKYKLARKLYVYEF